MAEITQMTEVQQMNLEILRLVQSDTAAAEKAIEHYYDVTDKPPVWGNWTPAK